MFDFPFHFPSVLQSTLGKWGNLIPSIFSMICVWMMPEGVAQLVEWAKFTHHNSLRDSGDKSFTSFWVNWSENVNILVLMLSMNFNVFLWCSGGVTGEQEMDKQEEYKYEILIILTYFQVVHSRRESDAGVYWCEAKNELGVVRSRNATLQVSGMSFCYLYYDLFSSEC